MTTTETRTAGDRLRDPAPDVRRAALQDLIRLAPPGTGDTLAWALADRDEQVRRIAADALRDLDELYIGEDGTRALLLAAAGGRDERVRATAAELLTLLTGGATALRTAPPEIAITPLLAALRDRVVDVRRAAVRSLEQWAADRPEVLTALTEALADPDPGVRTQVRWALA